MQQVISTDKAPRAIGPYSQAISANGFLFVSGQIAINPETGEILDAPAAEQTRLVLSNLKAILEAAGSDLSHVVKTTVYLKDLKEFEAINQVYSDFFGRHKPARACVEVSRLPRDVAVEIDAIAALKR